MAAHCSGCVFMVCVCSLLCVCTLDGLNAEHKFRVWVTILGHMSLFTFTFSRCGVKTIRLTSVPTAQSVLDCLSSFRGRTVVPLKHFRGRLADLSLAVVNTITQVRAPSMRQAYALKWSLFAEKTPEDARLVSCFLSCRRGWSTGCRPPPWKCMWLL